MGANPGHVSPFARGAGRCVVKRRHQIDLGDSDASFGVLERSRLPSVRNPDPPITPFFDLPGHRAFSAPTSPTRHLEIPSRGTHLLCCEWRSVMAPTVWWVAHQLFTV